MCRQSIKRYPLIQILSILLLFNILSSSTTIVVTAIKNPSTTLSFIKPKSNNNMVSTRSKADPSSSSVLRELKDTISSQASEINELKKELKAISKQSSNKQMTTEKAGVSHGHGPPVDNEDIIDYASKSFLTIAFERVGWLAIFLFSLSFTAIIMNGFEHTLSKQIELAYFVPLMAGHGGNTGGQAVGTILSALSAGVITRKDAMRVVMKEAMSGFTMGVILGSIVGPISHYVMGISVHVSTVVSVTFPLLSTIAAFLGSGLPFVCVWLGVDPAVIAAPAMTSFVDVTGLLAYFLLANKIFELFGMEL